MNLKYYLRGLGIGMVVAAILMGVATQGSKPITDAEIKERAAQLGMVEQKVLADIATESPGQTSEAVQAPTQKPTTEVTQAPTEVPTEVPASEATQEPASAPTEAPTQAPTEAPTSVPTEAPTQKPTEAPTQEPTSAPTEAPTSEPQESGEETVVLVIRSGESSWTVSKNLVTLGLIDDAAAFDSFLSRGGYDKSIHTGEFKIAKGATFEEIAKIIAK